MTKDTEVARASSVVAEIKEHFGAGMKRKKMLTPNCQNRTMIFTNKLSADKLSTKIKSTTLQLTVRDLIPLLYFSLCQPVQDSQSYGKMVKLNELSIFCVVFCVT